MQCPKCKQLKCDCILPHSFDLLFDIKTYEKLAQEYVWACERLDNLNEMCKDYEIDTRILRDNYKNNL
jgi:hypothetical protein